MNQTYKPLTPPSGTRPTPASNPFARALAETEQNTLKQNQRHPHSPAPASQADNYYSQLNQGYSPLLQDPLAERERAALEMKKAQERRRLHEQINPVETTELFNTRSRKVKEEIDALRQELKALAVDIAQFHKEVDLTLMTTIVDPGQEGKYYLNFFQQLRAFIMLLRQKIKSARTWATQMNAKQGKKKRRKISAGIDVGGQSHEQTASVYDMMHHERSNAFGG